MWAFFLVNFETKRLDILVIGGNKLYQSDTLFAQVHLNQWASAVRASKFLQHFSEKSPPPPPPFKDAEHRRSVLDAPVQLGQRNLRQFHVGRNYCTQNDVMVVVKTTNQIIKRMTQNFGLFDARKITHEMRWNDMKFTQAPWVKPLASDSDILTHCPTPPPHYKHTHCASKEQTQITPKKCCRF